jgi:hypothetical protein
MTTLPTDVSSPSVKGSLKSPCSAKTNFVSLFSLMPPRELPPPPKEPLPSILSFTYPIDPRERIDMDLPAEIPFSIEDADLFSVSSPRTDSGGCTIIDSKSSCVGNDAVSEKLEASDDRSSGSF